MDLILLEFFYFYSIRNLSGFCVVTLIKNFETKWMKISFLSIERGKIFLGFICVASFLESLFH